MWGRLRRAREFFADAEARVAAAPRRATPPLARDAVLVALDPERGRLPTDARYVVAAALLGELAGEGRLSVSDEDKKPRVVLHDRTPLGDDLLDDALLTIASGVFGTRLRILVGVMPDASQILRRLVADGAVVQESYRWLGLVTVRRFRPTPASGRDELVTRVRSTLLGEAVPDERTALLVSALRVVLPSRTFVPKPQAKEADRRQPEILARLGDDVRAVVAAVRTVRWQAQD